MLLALGWLGVRRRDKVGEGAGGVLFIKRIEKGKKKPS